MHWANRRVVFGLNHRNDEQVLEAIHCATSMRKWRNKNWPRRREEANASAATWKRLPEIFAALSNLYDPIEALIWLTAPQPLLSKAVPMELIKHGQANEVLQLLQEILAGVYT
jgi:hypothetical protein